MHFQALSICTALLFLLNLSVQTQLDCELGSHDCGSWDLGSDANNLKDGDISGFLDLGLDANDLDDEDSCTPATVDPSPIQHVYAEDGLEVTSAGNKITWCQAICAVSCICYQIWPWYNQPLMPLKHDQVSRVAFSSCYVPSYVPEDSNFWQQVSPKNLFSLTIFNDMSSSKWAFGWLVDLFIFGSERGRTQFKEYWIIFCPRGEEREPRSLVVAWWQRLQWWHQHGSQKEQVGFYFKNTWMIHEQVGFHQRKTL